MSARRAGTERGGESTAARSQSAILIGAVLLPRPLGHRRHVRDALAAVTGGAGLTVTALLATTDHIGAFERVVFDVINGLPHAAAPALYVVMRAGSFPAVFVAAGLALAARRLRSAVALAVGGSASWFLAKAVRQLVDRGRPVMFFHDVVVHGPTATGLGLPRDTRPLPRSS